MGWPAPNSYREAIQCPQICFADPLLKNAEVMVDHQGLPAVSSGNYASVYSLLLPSGQKCALRCFNHRVPDQEQRYQEISRQLQMSRLSYTVDFRFVAGGMLVEGERYPVLQMEWVEGETLIAYVERNLSKPDKLQALARQWLEMSLRMLRACIAHGDLQHGNILISDDAIKLIDYDGMYVPALEGLKSNERGHRNYQHPARKDEFGPQLDNFSFWIIYCSLLILSLDASLFHEVNGHDECLLFSESDFVSPGSSGILSLLLQHKSERLRSIAALLTTIIESELSQIPDLNHNLAPPPVDENKDFARLLRMLGLDSASSLEDIRQSAALFSKVWQGREFRRTPRLHKRAQIKLAELESGVEHLKKLMEFERA